MKSLNYLEPKDRLNFKGSILTFEQFTEKYANGNQNEATAIVETLIRKGNIKLVDKASSKQDLAIKQADKEEIIRLMADEIDAQEEQRKDFKADIKRQDRLTYQEAEIQYPNQFKAAEAELYFKEKLRLKETEIRVRNGICYLVVKNVTDAELNYINRVYTADNVIKAGVDLANKGAESMVGAVDYTAKKIVTPVVEIGAKTSMGLLRALTGTLVKTGATIVNAGSQSIKQTARDIQLDPDIIRARRELTNTKDDLKRTIVNKSSGRSSGIRVIQ